ncbi:cytochrome P450 [Serendipita vermifera]|nr:cytochrome P450 [Serendipita vermifera]
MSVPVVRALRKLLWNYSSPLRDLPVPDNASFVLGHLNAIRKADGGDWHEAMLDKYGHVMRYKAFFGSDRMFTIDPKAVNHILANSLIYEKPDDLRNTLGRYLGEGAYLGPGSDHKRQRRIMNPAFSIGHIREMTEIFVSKANELKDVLLDKIPAQGGTDRVDMLSYLSKTTLDVIGLAGFNYEFNALKDESSELSTAFESILQSTGGFPLFQVLKEHIPLLRYILRYDSLSRNLDRSQKTMREIGKKLIAQKKKEIEAEKEAGNKRGSKDLLTLLIRSNMSEKAERLTDDEVLNQIPTFLLAGHETTSTSTSWGLLALAAHQPVQTRLRQELRAVQTDSPTMDQLNSLSYLDSVVREILRYDSVVTGAIRVATQDDVIPLEKPFVDRFGNTRDSIRVRKGDSVFVSVIVMNKSKSIWGEDAKEFNPDRWLALPKAAQSNPGVWGNQLTFLGGPRACIGFRFAVTEMKALLFALIRSFEFELAVPLDDIFRRSSIVTRPGVKSEPEKGNQMPLIVHLAP